MVPEIFWIITQVRNSAVVLRAMSQDEKVNNQLHFKFYSNIFHSNDIQ